MDPYLQALTNMLMGKSTLATGPRPYQETTGMFTPPADQQWPSYNRNFMNQMGLPSSLELQELRDYPVGIAAVARHAGERMR